MMGSTDGAAEILPLPAPSTVSFPRTRESLLTGHARDTFARAGRRPASRRGAQSWGLV